ncbi:MAG: hypothetical protein IRZ11_06790 [Clostridia bacterium]|nr:hypothetical protein [Clostridia bacterium]
MVDRVRPHLYFALRGFLAAAEGDAAPVVVVREGRVADANAAARVAGVRRGQREAEARQACPQARYVTYVAERYRERREAALEAASRLSPTVEPDGDGAAWVLLGAGEDARPAAERLGRELLPRLAEEMWAGAGPNPWTAKLAAIAIAPCAAAGARSRDLLGLSFAEVRPEEAAERLAPLPVALLDRVLPGVSEQLLALGLRTFGEVRDTPPAALRRALGAAAIAAQGYCRGEDGRKLRPLWPRPAVVRALSFPDPVAELGAIARALDRLASELAAGLRKAGCAGREVTLVALTEEGSRWRASRRFARARAGESVRHALHLLWAGVVWPAMARGAERRPLGVRSLEASVGDLRERAWEQVPVWEAQARRDPAEPRGEAGRALEDVVEALRLRFPEAGVGFAASGSGGAGDWRERRLALWDPYRGKLKQAD